jgi:multidrug resistance efflux pump
MYEEAAANLTNNTNMHIIQAEGALTATELNLTMAQRNYEIARAEYEAGNNPFLLGAQSALNSARIHLETTQSDHERFERLYAAGGLSRNDLRQSENAVVHAQNAYNDAVTNLETAGEAERRALEQAEIALYAAVSAHRDAQTMLQTTRLATQQELDMLRSNLETIEIAGNIEPMEIAMNLANIEITSGLVAMEHAINLEIAQLNAAVQALEIALQLLERQLANSVVTSPINGTVTAVIATEGSVGMGPLFIVEDTENLRIMTSVREYEINKIAAGMAVVIQADATGTAEHEGLIIRISPSANIHSHIVEFEVEVAILSQDTGLRIGMNTRISVDLE